MGKKLDRALKAGVLLAGAGIAGKVVYDTVKRGNDKREGETLALELFDRDYTGNHAYLVGGGLATMAAAAYLIRDCGFPGDRKSVV